jgi:hypothetical protein
MNPLLVMFIKKVVYFSFNFISLFGLVSVPITYIEMREVRSSGDACEKNW